MKVLNTVAAHMYFRLNNTPGRRPLGHFDLHDLRVGEAVEFAEEMIAVARMCGFSKIHFIVGKGIHSRKGIARIKPAIQDLAERYQLYYYIPPENTGVVVVLLPEGDAEQWPRSR
ncbi:hypothetical protein BV25DRAFT_1824214 [Artomyces pyxidatus]|uniref:Uncharacterized protein n=1 Tax=Artomyces pyxidatus TaxID=48021 RepID=A0ACB8T4G2_9AGAM|nr:hypothetical protein BV25DRAFT_1824214 [Artomyces pyxidatus]